MDIRAHLGNDQEKPLDRLVDDGGFCSIFRRIGCIGDSLSSGEFEAVNEKGEKSYHDLYEHSWGQYLARMTGATALNFSRGGMTAREYWHTFAEDFGYWDPEKACQAYIIALGVNDLFNEHIDLGNFGDHVGEPKHTFAGYYGAIIEKMKIIQPEAKFFLVTMPMTDQETPEGLALKKSHASLLHQMAKEFSNTYVIDLLAYAPVYDSAFRNAFFMGGHMNPCGYYLTAKFIGSYIDYIIRHNFRDFRQVGFIGTGLSYRD